MSQRKGEKARTRVVWRMSAANPAGVYLDSAGRPLTPTKTVAPESNERGFRTSTYELSSGAEVVETPLDSLPGELIDEFSKKPLA